MATPATDSQARPHRSPRRRLILIGIAASPVVVLFAGLAYVQHRINLRVLAAIAEADRDDPNWRLAALEAHRAPAAGPENPAIRTQAAFALIPRGRFETPNPTQGPRPPGPPGGYPFYEALTKLEPDAPIPPVLAAALIETRAADAEALAMARPLADLGEGRYPLTYSQIWIATLLPHIQNTRNVARLLHLDAIDRAEAGDADGALDSCRAILGVARSIGDEPIGVSQIVRMANDRIATEAIERVLNRSVASDAALARLDKDLAHEEAIPFLLIGTRGERAGLFDVTEKIATGEIAPASLKGLTDGPADAYLVYPMQLRAFDRYNQALILEFQNRGVAIARRPLREQPALWEEWKRSTAPGSELAKFVAVVAQALKTDLGGAAKGQLLTVADLRLARVAVAAERFRLARGRWPDRLDELVPNFLASIPEDPYTGSPIRLVPAEGGRVVYAVGIDGMDDGGKTGLRNGIQKGTDLTFRLTDPDRRRRAAPELPGDVFPRSNP